MSSPDLGVGISPLGVGAYGFGTPAVAPVPGGKVNRDSRGLQLGSLAISLEPGTKGQYVFDEFGRRKGMSDSQHMVILALTEVLGKCIVKDLGARFFETRKIYESFEQDQKQRVNEALAALVARKLIAIDSITVDPGDGSPGETHVILTDLTTQTPINVTIPNG